MRHNIRIPVTLECNKILMNALVITSASDPLPGSVHYLSLVMYNVNKFIFLHSSFNITCTAVSKGTTFLALLHSIPASILGSIISMADIASNRPNLLWDGISQLNY